MKSMMKMRPNILAAFAVLTSQLFSFSLALAGQNEDWFTEISSSNNNQVIKYKNSVALLIYVSDYTKLPPVPHARKETEDLAEALKQQGFKVEIVESPRDKYGLESALDSFATKYLRMNGLTDRALIYFSGHGYKKPSDVGNLLPADTPEPRIGNENDPGFFSYAVDMEGWLGKTKQVYKSKQLLVVLDSCFSGAFISSYLVDPSASDQVNKLGSEFASRQFLTAGGEWEIAPAKSLFTPLFIGAINGDADLNSDGLVTVSEIAQYIKVKMINAAGTELKTSPQYGRIIQLNKERADGDMVFSNKAKTKGASLKVAEIQRSGGNVSDVMVDSQTSKRRAKYAVFYYGKPQNNEKVKGILARLGFLKSSQEEATNPRAYDSLWVGRGVDMADVKQLAYAMMQAGIKLKAIRSFDGNGTRKSMTIEIGAHDGSGEDDLKVKSPNCRPLTAEQIDGIVAIDRTTLMCGK